MIFISNIIAAIRTEDELNEALQSDVGIIFDLAPNILRLMDNVKKVHASGKKIFIHIDLAEGIGKDKPGLEYSKNCGVDGIISTRINIIKAARELGLFSVQRFFIVDSHSIATTVEAIKSSKADMIEIMPGIVPKVIKKLRAVVNTPIIAGGLIETQDEINAAIKSGAYAVSSGEKSLWN